MSVLNTHGPRPRAVAHAAPQSRLMDRLFVGGCTALYLVLIGAVLTALKLYGGS